MGLGINALHFKNVIFFLLFYNSFLSIAMIQSLKFYTFFCETALGAFQGPL